MYNSDFGGIYAPFSFVGSSNEFNTRTFEELSTRNFNDLVTERGTEYEKRVYSDIFEKIREKLFISSEADDIELTDSDKKIFNEKYKISSTQETINEIKREIAQLYVKKTEHEILIQERRKLFDVFCTNISNSITSINNINANVKIVSEKDTTLKDLLNDRIDWYYAKLDLDNLVNQEYSIKSEFYFLKQTLQELSSISPGTICSICMENQVSWFIDPCGHTLCENCKIKTISLNNCHYCRATRTKFNKLYL